MLQQLMLDFFDPDNAQSDPVIPAFPDLHLSPAAIMKELSSYFPKFVSQARLLALPSPHELQPREAQEYPFIVCFSFLIVLFFISNIACLLSLSSLACTHVIIHLHAYRHTHTSMHVCDCECLCTHVMFYFNLPFPIRILNLFLMLSLSLLVSPVLFFSLFL